MHMQIMYSRISLILNHIIMPFCQVHCHTFINIQQNQG